MTAAASARATFDAGVQGALKAANLPSAGDVQSLRQKIGELEQLIDDLSARLDAEEAAPPATPGTPPDGPR
jgi:tetrahydromethanopterin S-methyltransferase subunit B